MQLSAPVKMVNLMDLSSTCAGKLDHCSDGHTMAFWLKVTSVATPTGSESFVNGNLFEMGMLNMTACKFDLKNIVAQQKHSGTFLFQEGKWVHYASTFDKMTNTAKLYMDGQFHSVLNRYNATVNGAATSFMVIRMTNHNFELDDLFIFDEHKDADFLKSLYFDY